ncbi:MAG: Gfo/Idh/MocA family oxidoreductase [Thermoguttaceae bacterium]|jgi:predicted dehydrogenase
MNTCQDRTPAGRASRRQFLLCAGTALGAAALPTIVPATVFGAASPSNRIQVGFIGCGNQSEIDLPAFLGQDDAQVLAVCDVNTASGGYRVPKQFLGRKPAQEKVNAHYAAAKPSGRYKGCDACNDFREILARPDIDVVTIVVPDHWHALMTVMAARAGKDIYCEKPLSLCLRHGRTMVEAVRKHKRVLQTGTHYRSSPAARLACELVRNGRIGKLRKIMTYVAENNAVDPGPGWKPMPVPEGFDYPFWLGPAPLAPYHKDRCFYRFRFNLDYSGGQTTNFGTHTNDLAQWALGTDHSGPIELEDTGGQWPPPGGLYNTASKVSFCARYANGVELHCQTSKDRFGARFIGTEGWVQYTYGGVETEPASLKDSPIGPNEIHLAVSNPARKEEQAKYHVPDHVRNFLACVRARKDPLAAAEVGHRSTSICHLGNIAMRLKRKLRWDPVKEEFPGDDEANRMLDRPMRAPWSLG